MDHHPALLLPLSAAGLGAVGLFTIPAVVAVINQVRSGAPKDNFYEDRDGKSTPEALAAFSTKKIRLSIFVSACLGLATSLAVSVLAVCGPGREGSSLEAWLTTASWGLVLAQSVLLGLIHAPVLVHDVGHWVSASSLVIIIIAIFRVPEAESSLGHDHVPAQRILSIVNVVLAALLSLGGILIRRRPEVFIDGRPVDYRLSASTLSRYTWSYARPVLDLATKKGDLDNSDIPHPDHTVRTQEVVADWLAFGFRGKLAGSLAYAYKGRLAMQWSVIIFRCFLSLVPFWSMLQLINILQERGGGGSPTPAMWAFVLLLAGTSMFAQWIDTWVNHYSMIMVSLPMRAQLSALIYLKSLRRKNTKNADKPTGSDEPATAPPLAETDSVQGASDALPADTADDTSVPGHGSAEGDPSLSKNVETGKTEDGKAGASSDDPSDESVLKSQQAIVNLVGVDTRRVTTFAAIQSYIIGSIGNLIVYSGFLIKLIGWIPFTAGVVAWALVLPFNTYFSKRYMRLSDDIMKVRDKKLATINEALLGIRQIKFAALERNWEKRITGMREDELKVTWKIFVCDIVLFACWVVSPIFLATAALASYALLHGGLTPSVAFVSITVFNALEVTLGALPEFLTSIFDTLISIKRIDTYLKGPEMEETLTRGSDVAFENATIAWPVDGEVNEEDRFILRDVNLLFPAGELSVISGKTGVGKSLILSALIGEVDVLDGKIVMPPTVALLDRHDGKAHAGNWILPGSVAYVSQTPWLENASLQDNILFGLPMDETRYAKVLDVCALRKDLETLTDGDKTELGANGINLSGGQKWRITLARCIYSRAEILIMDDIFSAVDAHVGRHIFEKCLAGDICKGRTRILVTHHVGLVQPLAKFIVELGAGSVMYSGATEDLFKDGTLEKIVQMELPAPEASTDGGSSSLTADNSDEVTVADAGEESEAQQGSSAPKTDNGAEGARKFVEEETREKGIVKRKIYVDYLAACGSLPRWVIYIGIFMAFETINIGRTWWVKVWTGSENQSKSVGINSYDEHGNAYGFVLQQGTHYSMNGPMVAEADNGKLAFYLGIYVALSLGSGFIGAARYWWAFLMSIRGSRVLFGRILKTVLRTPLRWLDTVPVGRVLNRMTSDFEIIDQRLTTDMGLLLWQTFAVIGVCVAAALVSPYILPLAAVLIAICALIARKYLDGARPLKRIESTSKSPVFELFNATLSGLSSLRAFQKTNTYVTKMYKHLDLWDSDSVYIWTVNRWVAMRMAFIGVAFTACVGVLVIITPRVDASMAGFTLSFALDFSMTILLVIRAYSNLELDMNAAERVIEYSELETESQGGTEPPAAWPTSGRMEVRDLEVGYAKDLPAVLKGVTFDVKDNERIGVIGRTGAGKSSLTLALFRFLEARAGTVFIDGIDISKMDLHSLRSRLAIIPQDPVLFSGTIRSNLDPFDERTDDELRESLARVHLVSSAAPTPAEQPSSAATSTLTPQNVNVFKNLSSPVSESGGNLSQGQRQLLCLARAIVSRPKLMVLDEATSAVDMATDALIQRSIREEFSNSTLIVIAHRLSTIVDFDRILVLSDGKVAEFGTPRELWELDGGIFRDMCNKSGEKGKLEATIFGKE